MEDAFCDSIRSSRSHSARALPAGNYGSRHVEHFILALDEQPDFDDLDPAEDAGLIAISMDSQNFATHWYVPPHIGPPPPAGDGVRISLLHRSSSSRRAQPFRTSSLAFGGCSHRAQRSPSRNIQIAADHEFAAANYTIAGKLYKRSSELTPPGNNAMRRMLQAADALRLAGAIDEARTLLRHAMTLGSDAELRVAIDYAHYRLQVYAGGMIDGRDGLIRDRSGSRQIHPAQAAQILGDAALASMVIGDLPTARATAEQACS